MDWPTASPTLVRGKTSEVRQLGGSCRESRCHIVRGGRPISEISSDRTGLMGAMRPPTPHRSPRQAFGGNFWRACLRQESETNPRWSHFIVAHHGEVFHSDIGHLSDHLWRSVFMFSVYSGCFSARLTPSQLRDFFATTRALSPPKRGSSDPWSMESAPPLVRDPYFMSQQLPTFMTPTPTDNLLTK